MSKTISFIIPVYNVEKYLNECVDSILRQITSDCEIILIDDGSTDSSGTICDEYANRDSKVRVIHQNNGGLASARNAGLDHAQGNYIAFVDSDDYLADGCVSRIISWINSGGSDICFMRAQKFFPNGKTQQLDDEIKAEEMKKDKSAVIKYLSQRSKYPGSPCTKILRRSLIEENSLRFPEDGRVSEDLGFVLQCILFANSYDSLPFNYYYYRQAREGSITNKITYRSFGGLKLFVEESVDLLTENRIAKGLLEKYMMSFVAYEYSIMVWQYGCIEKKWTKEAECFLKDYSWVLKYSNTKKTKIIRKLIEYIGINVTSKVMVLYMATRKLYK